MTPTVTQQVEDLATWTRTVHDSPADGIQPEVNAAAAELNDAGQVARGGEARRKTTDVGDTTNHHSRRG